METVTVAKMQALEFAKSIAEARDEELAFLLQLQEIVKSTTNLLDDHELEESSSQPLIDLQDSHIEADKDKAVALTVAVDQLKTIAEETEETYMSLLEADRLARLDAIQEHDAHFAHMITNTPCEEWEETGDEMADPIDTPRAPTELCADNEVDDQLNSALRQLGEEPLTFPKKRSHGSCLLILRLAKMPAVMILTETEQREKGKKLLDEDDDEALPESSHSGGNPIKRPRGVFLQDNLEHKDGDATGQTDAHLNVDECGQRICRICFDAPPATSPFVVLEGCGHTFCETCLSRHAKAKILDGLAHIICPHIECQIMISFTQLTYLLNMKMLEILSKRQIEAAIPDSERLYCPFKDCSALLCKPSNDFQLPSGSAHPHRTAFGCVECDACHRAFCMECEVVWHGDMSCAEYKANLKNDRLLGDKKLLQLADKQKWRRCQCGRVVELATGCYHISCLCGNNFCYLCGAPWPKKHKKPCSCPMWNESIL